MFATVNYCSCFWLLLCLALSLLDHAYAQTNIGDRCSTSEGPGACRLISECPSVYNGLRSGKWPEVNCGFQGDIPIVCCPSYDVPPSRTTTSGPLWEVVTPEINKRPVNPSAGVRISTQVCAEYERSMFGQVNRSPGPKRVINGTVVKPKEFPHMAAVGFNTGSAITWDCGGTLISDRFVLTAAHCTNSPQWGEAQWVSFGVTVISSDNKESQLLRIVEKIRYPEYHRPRKYHDIALLKLERSVIFDVYVRPACLDTKENHAAGIMTVAAGWGLTDFTDFESRSANLLKVDLPIVAHSNCASYYSHDSSGLPHGIDDQSQICAGEIGKDTCQGDSGGPLIMKIRRPLTLFRVAGITSFGQSCGSIVPGVYTRVSFYLSWIESVVWPDKLV